MKKRQAGGWGDGSRVGSSRLHGVASARHVRNLGTTCSDGGSRAVPEDEWYPIMTGDGHSVGRNGGLR